MSLSEDERWRDGFLAGWLAAGKSEDDPEFGKKMRQIQAMVNGRTFFGTQLVGGPMTLREAMEIVNGPD